MKSWISRGMVVGGISIALVAFAGILGLAVKAQAQEMQQHLAELKQLLAFNKQAMGELHLAGATDHQPQGRAEKRRDVQRTIGSRWQASKRRSIPAPFPTVNANAAASVDASLKRRRKSTRNTAIR